MTFEEFMDLFLQWRATKPLAAMELCKDAMKHGEDILTKKTAAGCLGMLKAELAQ